MKILAVSVFEPGKAAEAAKVLDKILPNTPGYKAQAMYMCMGILSQDQSHPIRWSVLRLPKLKTRTL